MYSRAGINLGRKNPFDLDIQLDSTVFISDAQSQTSALIFLFDMKHINIGQNSILQQNRFYVTDLRGEQISKFKSWFDSVQQNR